MLDRLTRLLSFVARTTVAAVRYVSEDARTACATDPAAGSHLEVLTYPGLHAVWFHRIESHVWDRGFEVTARVLSHVTRFLTGVEIHPGADVGRRVFVDHGMGVVVGETAEIGDDVLMYQGVTLGGGSLQREKRHPSIEDGATIGANATLVGAITIGERATIGAGSVVVDDVPPGVTVAGNPAQVVGRDGDDVKPYGVTDQTAPDGKSTSGDERETGVREADESGTEDSSVDEDDGTASA